MTVKPGCGGDNQIEQLSNLVIRAAITFVADGKLDLRLGSQRRQRPRSAATYGQ